MSIPPAPQPLYQTPPSPWSAPPPAPPRRSRIGLIAAIAGGVVLLIVALAATMVLVGMGVENSFPPADSSLTVRPELVDGRFTLNRDDSSTLGLTMQNSWRRSWDAEDIHGIAATYKPEDGERGSLVVTGMYGRFKNTDRMRAHVLADNASKNTQVTVLVKPQDDTPAGSPVHVSCDIVTRKWADGTTLSYPVCAWADGNSWARVADMTRSGSVNLDLKATAKITLEVRTEMRTPIK
ncbi:hypothetical protein [Streptomyces sp. NPDC093970]|uniref:hypothetical protein n=1 Tax=Streptomyces sp. NPDC093970 TaxID=3155076 RepID=UPI0034482277